jgi:hypothetical protein
MVAPSRCYFLVCEMFGVHSLRFRNMEVLKFYLLWPMGNSGCVQLKLKVVMNKCMCVF